MPEWKPCGTVETLADDSVRSSAVVIRTTAGSTAADIIQALGGMQNRIALLLLGGSAESDPAMKQKLGRLFSNAIIPAAADACALVIDGTTPRMMEMISGGLAFRRQRPATIGILAGERFNLPGAVPQQGNIGLALEHSGFVLCEPDAVLKTRFRVAESLSESVPVIAVLIGGEDDVATEAVACIRSEWPLIVVKETGGLADRIASLVEAKAGVADGNADLAEIVQSPKVRVMSGGSAAGDWQQAIEGRSQNDQTLANIRNEYNRWDTAAVAYRKSFVRMQWTAATLAVAATLCAILQPEWTGTETAPAQRAVHYAIIAIPLLTSGLLAWMSFFRPGSQWLLLRGGAESIKSEIFRYRTRSGIYADRQRGAFRATRLAQEVERIRTSLKKSEANKAGEPPMPSLKAGDGEELSPLSGDQYVQQRLQNQIRYYESKTQSLYRHTKWYQALILLGGGLGAFLAAVGVNKWVALTTAVVTALTARREAEQQEASIIQYNQALGGLRAIEDWWSSLSVPEKANQHSVDRLVSQAEAALASELAGWIQQMETAVEKIQKPADATTSKPAAETPASPVMTGRPADEARADAETQPTGEASAAAAGAGVSDS